MKKNIFALSTFLLFLSLFYYGCNNDRLLSISGNVTLDGKPLPEGIIMFLPSGTEGNSASTTITNGKYSVRVSPGKMVIRILAERPYTEEEIKKLRANPMYNNDPMFQPEKMKKQYLPQKYNEKSLLNEEIHGNNKSLNFNLECSEEL
ncbi:MAG: carboxypeptidase-like regulatory domain-containing protein [Planctomycetaceae bacterium]|jgi:hypothetical protein|nr:carboxypeptidase-like regulatory domain-containing protein [Planctomycetaceae bacterium]